MRRHLTWHNFIGIVAMIANISGSLLVASNTGNTWYGYLLYFVGIVPSTWLMYVSDVNKTLLLTNFYFFAVTIFGVIRYWP